MLKPGALVTVHVPNLKGKLACQHAGPAEVLEKHSELLYRVRFLGKRLDELKVVDTLPSDRDKIFFGAWVTLEDDDGEETCYRIVGPDEFDLASGKLSMDAPLARAMLGKRLDDEVLVSTPTGEKCYYVCAIHYGDKPDTNT